MREWENLAEHIEEKRTQIKLNVSFYYWRRFIFKLNIKSLPLLPPSYELPDTCSRLKLTALHSIFYLPKEPPNHDLWWDWKILDYLSKWLHQYSRQPDRQCFSICYHYICVTSWSDVYWPRSGNTVLHVTW